MMERKDAVVVRRCEAADVELITATEPPGARVTERLFARQQRGESLYLVAWLDGAPVGSGEITFAAPRELRNLHVADGVRGRGIGTAIVRAAEEASIEAGTLSIGVGTDNTAARRLYERLGYRGTGEITTTTYTYVDADGEHEATETDERLEKRLAQQAR